jgi:hypothetical protein
MVHNFLNDSVRFQNATIRRFEMNGGLPYAICDSQVQTLLAELQQHAPNADGYAPKDNHITRHRFTPEEDELLRTLVERLGTQDWPAVSHHFLRRSPRQCRDRWRHYLSPELRSDIWTDNENTLLFAKVAEFGPHWSQVALSFPGRTDIRVKNHYMTLKTKQDRQAACFLDPGHPE